MTKIPEAQARMFTGVFVCRNCKAKIRTTSARIKAGKVKCRKCGSRALRAKKTK